MLALRPLAAARGPSADASSRPPAAAAALAALRSGLVSAALTACLLLPAPLPAAAEPAAAPASTSGGSAPLTTVYFGNGCFWGRQKDFVEVEMRTLGRPADQVTALVGYAAGTATGPDGRVCYVYSDPKTRYDELGHAEVVALGVDPGAEEAEVRAFARAYFKQFQRTIDQGMMRLDPQDAGAAYRNVIGLPGGVRSPLFPIIQEANVNGMELREGKGNVVRGGRDTENDELNVVWVVDSEALPFYRAERYHQFHHGLGKRFPETYVRGVRDTVAATGRIEPVPGCLEFPELPRVGW
ncbi:hypothetical protein HYH03_010514 [Edaphochlamys debaryana]|uniref:peptide-methionine (S)-S-oxide reductase n=1 Tax=Edaphochlamys debaryana TaxID=47281 RepID=A0A835XWF4_9CHLO|nr:hypothetical protein HYH03_010514 [Edaphochlamys debaryana]|eukprot:KAG2491069.1 hypothetical protein HYH03_010514 [Edaphochlamys debaryana]